MKIKLIGFSNGVNKGGKPYGIVYYAVENEKVTGMVTDKCFHNGDLKIDPSWVGKSCDLVFDNRYMYGDIRSVPIDIKIVERG